MTSPITKQDGEAGMGRAIEGLPCDVGQAVTAAVVVFQWIVGRIRPVGVRIEGAG
ncbi:hypothetical protein [Burkholderia cenocepacia]|uniref:hypothetical protein n=1 Tax=Burkholderia cenocepacia TaxID=95486 RepID=UPI00192C0450|nr:hypothetical protein [Burkholderia cenocepacia]